MNKILISIVLIILFIFSYKYIYSYDIPEKFKYIEKNPIVISLTTSPKRINNIKPVIDSILSQTLLPNKIILNLPIIFKRDNSKFGKIPDFINENKLIYLNYCEDIGPITKILPTINLVTDNVYIISIDDDTIYHKDFIKTFIYFSIKFPDSVITGHSFLLDNTEKYKYIKQKDSTIELVELLEGFSGVLYKKKFLINFDIDTVINSIKECYLADDLTLSNHMRKNNIPIIKLSNYKVVKNLKQLDYGFKKDALHKGADNMSFGNKSNYNICSKYLKDNNKLYITNKDILMLQ